MIRWATVLHFYQPPTQKTQVTNAVFEQCYRPLIELIVTQPRARVTVNISGSLIREPFFQKLQPLIDEGRVELLVSPTTHPLLPLIGSEATEQLLMEQKRDGRTVGVFPPELAVNTEVVERVSRYGDYCLVDESSVGKNGGFVYRGHKLLASTRMVTEILRSYPKELHLEPFYKYVTEQFGSSPWLVSVNDAELFGHHYRERLEFLRQAFSDERFEFVTCREIVDQYADQFLTIENLVSSTWQTNSEDLQKNISWPLWQDPENALQKQYWDLALMAEKEMEPYWSQSEDPGLVLDSAKRHFFVGISSCHLYWLSNKPWWHPDLVEEGANQLIKCIRSLPVLASVKAVAEEKHKKLMTDMWQYHWSGEVEKGYVRHDKEREKLLASLPELT